MSSTTELIKEKLGILDVVSSYITVQKAGKNHKARCPFHNEKTPSFFISPERETYHCFGCDRGGDIFSFVQEIEGVDFVGALKILGERAGVPILSGGREGAKSRDNLYSSLERATLYYQSALSSPVREYLKKRGLTPKTISDFRIGFVADSWRGLSDFLTGKGVPLKDLIDVGLVIKKDDGGHYDRFRSRIMFPIQDSQGRVVGFSGRVFGEEGESTAKYINSPETELYHKSKILFGFDKAKVEIRKEDACMLVEGQMDVILAHQAGMKYSVAASGTALSLDQLNIISRLTDNLIMAFDADSAGVLAAGRSIDLALGEDFNVRVVALPKDSDPAEIIAKDTAEWERLVSEARHVVDFYLAVLHDMTRDDREYRKEVKRVVLPHIAAIGSSIERAHYVSKVAAALGVAESPVWEELASIAPSLKGKESRAEVRAIANEVVGDDPNDFRRRKIEEKIMGVVLWQGSLKKPLVEISKIKKQFKESTGGDIQKRIETYNEKDRERIIYEAEAYFNNSDDIEVELQELFAHLREHILRIKFSEAMSRLRRAEARGDDKEVATELSRCNTISKELNEHTLHVLKEKTK